MEKTDPTARELLKEARDALYDEIYGIHNDELMRGMIKRKKRNDELLAQIDAKLSAPQDEAMETALAVIKLFVDAFNNGSPKKIGDIKREAAALIEERDRTVPVKFADDLFMAGFSYGRGPIKNMKSKWIQIDEIVAKHGVEVEENHA